MGTKVGEVEDVLSQTSHYLVPGRGNMTRGVELGSPGRERGGAAGVCTRTRHSLSRLSSPLASVQRNWQLSRRNELWFWLLRKRQIWQPGQKLPRSDPSLPHSRNLKEEAEKGAH